MINVHKGIAFEVLEAENRVVFVRGGEDDDFCMTSLYPLSVFPM